MYTKTYTDAMGVNVLLLVSIHIIPFQVDVVCALGAFPLLNFSETVRSKIMFWYYVLGPYRPYLLVYYFSRT